MERLIRNADLDLVTLVDELGHLHSPAVRDLDRLIFLGIEVAIGHRNFSHLHNSEFRGLNGENSIVVESNVDLRVRLEVSSALFAR